jgi:hypothetical protein
VAEVELAEDTLSIHVLGMDRLWALRSHLEIPLSHVLGAEADPEVARRWWQGIRSGGTHVPGVITAGTFHQEGERVFWDVHDPGRAIVIRLSATSDEMVVKVYPLRYEKTHLCASFERRRARDPGGGIALAGCLHLAPLPDTSRQLSGRERLPDRPRAGMQPANRPQRHPRLQRGGSPAGASARLQTSAHRSQGLRSGTGRGLARALAPHAQEVRQRHEPVDAGSSRRGQLRGGLDRRAHHWRNRPDDAGTDGGALGASQEVDRFSRSRVREKKGGATD